MKHLDAVKFKALKSPRYLKNYEKYFQAFTTEEIRLLELGIHEGGSLAMWGDYFPKAFITGLDFSECDSNLNSEKVRVYHGRQEDTALLDRIGAETAPHGFDIIIDDASHLGEWTRISFWHLFTHHLKAGGVYVIEDWGTGFFNDWPDGRQLRTSRMSVDSWMRSRLQKLLLWLLATKLMRHFASRYKKLLYLPALALYRQKFSSHSYGMVGFTKQLIDEFGKEGKQMLRDPSEAGTLIEKIEIHPGQIFISKKSNGENN